MTQRPISTMSSSSNTPPDDYFNDLSNTGNKSGANKRHRTPDVEDDTGGADRTGDHDNGVPKPKRIACVICRLGHNCAYDEVRRKSGPKRGYVKALEERLSKSNLLPNLGGYP